jgi:DNA-binding GntR family transcriptional regulator
VIALYGRSHGPACGHDDHVAFLRALESRDADHAALLMTSHLDQILADLDLAEHEETHVDLAVALRASVK